MLKFIYTYVYFVTVSSGLGIPHQRTLSTDYISEYSVPTVQSAPLVSYGPDDDHDLHRDSISVSIYCVFIVIYICKILTYVLCNRWYLKFAFLVIERQIP